MFHYYLLALSTIMYNTPGYALNACTTLGETKGLEKLTLYSGLKSTAQTEALTAAHRLSSEKLTINIVDAKSILTALSASLHGVSHRKFVIRAVSALNHELLFVTGEPSTSCTEECATTVFNGIGHGAVSHRVLGQLTPEVINDIIVPAEDEIYFIPKAGDEHKDRDFQKILELDSTIPVYAAGYITLRKKDPAHPESKNILEVNTRTGHYRPKAGIVKKAMEAIFSECLKTNNVILEVNEDSSIH